MGDGKSKRKVVGVVAMWSVCGCGWDTVSVREEVFVVATDMGCGEGGGCQLVDRWEGLWSVWWEGGHFMGIR